MGKGGAAGNGKPRGRASRGWDAGWSQRPTHENRGQEGSRCSFLIDGSKKTTRRNKGIGGAEISLSSASNLGILARLGTSNKISLPRLHPMGQTRKGIRFLSSGREWLHSHGFRWLSFVVFPGAHHLKGCLRNGQGLMWSEVKEIQQSNVYDVHLLSTNFECISLSFPIVHVPILQMKKGKVQLGSITCPRSQSRKMKVKSFGFILGLQTPEPVLVFHVDV